MGRHFAWKTKLAVSGTSIILLGCANVATEQGTISGPADELTTATGSFEAALEGAADTIAARERSGNRVSQAEASQFWANLESNAATVVASQQPGSQPTAAAGELPRRNAYCLPYGNIRSVALPSPVGQYLPHAICRRPWLHSRDQLRCARRVRHRGEDSGQRRRHQVRLGLCWHTSRRHYVASWSLGPVCWP